MSKSKGKGGVENGDIRSFTLITGMEILAEVESVEDNYFVVKEAFGIAASDDGQGGLTLQLRPLTAFATHESPTGGMPLELYYATILLSTNPPSGLIEHYERQTGAIITPPEKKIIV